MFSVVVLMILMTALFTTGIYTYVARDYFTRVKEQDLLRKAHAVIRVMDEFEGDMRSMWTMFERFTQDEMGDSLLGAHMLVIDANGHTLFVSESLAAQSVPSLNEAARQVLTQGELHTGQIPALKHTAMVGVGVPIHVKGELRGSVLLLVPIYEAFVAMRSLNNALIVSLMLSLPLTAVVLFYVIGRVINPLRQMTYVATHMAGGNFSRRADATQRGEVGQLGEALNYLSQELSRSISTLTLERNRLKQAINGLSEGIVAVNRAIQITHFNPAVQRLFSGPKPILTADERLELIPDAAIWADFRAVVEGGETISRQIHAADRTMMITIAPIHNEQQQIAGAVGLFSDITQSERLERTRRDYVANVSHEMRTPLTAMRALLEPLSEGMVASEETKSRYYAIMLRETMRLSRLINDLLELSRLQSGSLALSVEQMGLGLILAELQDKYEPIAEENHLTFAMDERLFSCPEVVSNPDRLEQLLVILIDNALKYTPEGGHIRLFADWDDEVVRLSVSDTGVGIAKEDLPYVFDRFYKVDKAHTGLGSGLGLSIARELLRLMGEEISVVSEVGVGSTFTFTMRRA